jgi:hypothetical protein
MICQMMHKFAVRKKTTPAGEKCVPFKTDAITCIAGQSKSHYTRNTSENAAVVLTCPGISKKKPICTSKSLLFHENPHYTLRKMAIHDAARTVYYRSKISRQFFSISSRRSPESQTPITVGSTLISLLITHRPAKRERDCCVMESKQSPLLDSPHRDLSHNIPFVCYGLQNSLFRRREWNFPVLGISMNKNSWHAQFVPQRGAHLGIGSLFVLLLKIHTPY